MRSSTHERTGFRAHLEAPSLPAGDHWPRRLAVLPLRAQRPRRGGIARRARRDPDRRNGPAVVLEVRPSRRERMAATASAPRRHVAPGRGVRRHRRRAAVPVARSIRTGRCSTSSSGRGAIRPPPCGSSANCSRVWRASRAWCSPTRSPARGRRCARCCRASSTGGTTGRTTAPRTRTSPRGNARCKSPWHAQRFLAAYGPFAGHFRPRRHRLTANDYRETRAERFATWRVVTGTPARA